MKSHKKTSSLRAAHRDLTHQRIIDAAIGLLREGRADALTLGAVAARAGMTQRTIYRHFETREALMAAVWVAVNRIVRTPELPRTPEALIGQPPGMFAAFDREEHLIRAIVTTPEGRDLRLSVNAERQRGMRAAVKAARPDVKEPQLTRLAAVVQLLDSSIAWLAMRDYWGLSGADAGRAASDAIAALLAAPGLKSKSRHKQD